MTAAPHAIRRFDKRIAAIIHCAGRFSTKEPAKTPQNLSCCSRAVLACSRETNDTTNDTENIDTVETSVVVPRLAPDAIRRARAMA